MNKDSSTEIYKEHIKNLTTTIEVHPSFLNNEIMNTLQKMLKVKFETKCFENIGYISSIKKINRIDNKITPDALTILFNISFSISYILPKIGDKFTFKVTLLLDKGIFGKLYDGKLNFFIPEMSLTNNDYNFEIDDESGNCFKKNTSYIFVGDFVSIKISAIKFDTDVFKCICCLNE